MVQIRNKDRLFSKLRRIAPSVEKALEVTNLKTAEDIASTARNLVEVRTGKLRDSIVMTGPGKSPPSHSQGSDVAVVPPGSAMVTAGNTGVRYAHHVEFGTPPHVSGGMFEGAQNPGTPPRPFFFPAYRVHAKRLKGRASRAISNAIKGVVK